MPIDPGLCSACDTGTPYVVAHPNTQATEVRIAPIATLHLALALALALTLTLALALRSPRSQPGPNPNPNPNPKRVDSSRYADLHKAGLVRRARCTTPLPETPDPYPNLNLNPNPNPDPNWKVCKTSFRVATASLTSRAWDSSPLRTRILTQTRTPSLTPIGSPFSRCTGRRCSTSSTWRSINKNKRTRRKRNLTFSGQRARASPQ